MGRDKQRVLVLGGTGAVGSAVLRALKARGCTGDFTWCSREDRAKALQAELGPDFTAHRIDLADVGAVAKLVSGLPQAPQVAIHCAGVSAPVRLMPTVQSGASIFWEKRWHASRRRPALYAWK